MATYPIKERASDRHRHIDVPRAIEESRRFWASPEGEAEQRRFELRKLRAVLIPSKFPELSKRGTRPAVSPLDEVADWSARFGIPAH